MKVYFACSIRGGRDDSALYAELVTFIKTKATVLTEIFADGKLTAQGSKGPTEDIWHKDLEWIHEADVVIAEVTNPSLGVGYEIAKAEELKKPVLALFRDSSERKLSAMIDGSPYTTTQYYNDVNEAKRCIVQFLSDQP